MKNKTVQLLSLNGLFGDLNYSLYVIESNINMDITFLWSIVSVVSINL